MKYWKRFTNAVRNKTKHHLGITALECEVEDNLLNRIKWLEQENRVLGQLIREATDVSADLSGNRHDASTIIVTGRFKNNDWVKIYPVQQNEFESMVHHLEHVAKRHRPSRIDAPYGMANHVTERLSMKGLL